MKKNLKFYQNLDYTVRLKQNSDGSFFAQIEELPGCMTEGSSRDEALDMIEDAKNAWLEIALQDGNAIPEPAHDEFSGKIHVRLPKYLHRSLTYRAKQEGVSLNTFISTSLSGIVGTTQAQIKK